MARPKSKLPEYLIEKITNHIFTWIRKCPKCNNDIIHTNLHAAKTCHKQKRLCYNCGCWNKGLTKETNRSIKKMSLKVSNSMKKLRKTIPPWNSGLSKENNEILKMMGKKHFGHRHTEETKKLIGEHSRNFWKDPKYRNTIIEKLKKIIGDPDHINQWRLKMERGGFFTPQDLKSEFQKYKELVWSHTRKNNLLKLENYEKRGRTKFHLDHKYSITQGFLDDIPAEIIGSIYNLVMIPHIKNIQKNSKCSISKEELLNLFYANKN